MNYNVTYLVEIDGFYYKLKSILTFVPFPKLMIDAGDGEHREVVQVFMNVDGGFDVFFDREEGTNTARMKDFGWKQD